MGCFGSSRAVLIDGRLESPATKDALTYFNVSEKVILVEQFHKEYIVIGIQAVDSAGSDI
jgi:hypothetical protein